MYISGNKSVFPVLTGQEAAEWDAFSIQKNIDSRLLMGWAGYSAFSFLSRQQWYKNAENIHFLCGSGNNGGDGYVVAWHILSSSLKKIFIWQLDQPKTEDARYFSGLCSDTAFKNRFQVNPYVKLNNLDLEKADVVVDALFGTGLNKPPGIEIENIIRVVNAAHNITRVALDISSGVYSSGDYFSHEAFRADHTLAFGCYKTGQLLEPGILYSGKIDVMPIGFFPVEKKAEKRPMEAHEVSSLRKMAGHKYTSGVLKTIGGSRGMEGAAILASRAFLALGGGLSKIFSTSGSMVSALEESPEIMIRTESDILELLNHYQNDKKSENEVSVIGPGLAEKIPEKTWRDVLLDSSARLVIDGSGLSQITDWEPLFLKNRCRVVMLTPHKAEAERILGKKIQNVRTAALEISERFNASIYLKGPGGILVLRNSGSVTEVYPNSLHYELSTGGTGDVLCGFLANFILRFADPYEGLEAGLYTYLTCASNLIQKNFSNRDLLTPSELIREAREFIS